MELDPFPLALEDPGAFMGSRDHITWEWGRPSTMSSVAMTSMRSESKGTSDAWMSTLRSPSAMDRGSIRFGLFGGG